MKVERKQTKKNGVSSFPRPHQNDRFSLYRLVSMAGLILILGLLSIIGFQYFEHHRLQQELAAYEQEIEYFNTRKETLSVEIERLEDIEYLEVLARKRLGLVKPGEIVFQFED